MYHRSGLLEGLNAREKEIIRYRYGLDGAGQPMTLREVGGAMNGLGLWIGRRRK